MAESPLTKKLEHIFALTAAERDVLEQACQRVREYGPREDIIQKGDRPWQSNLLLSGMVCRYRNLPNGRRQIMAFQYAGDVFDAYSFVLEVMDHSIATLSRASVAAIAHETMYEITENHPRLARAFWKDTLIDTAVFAEWMTNVRAKPPEAQVAHLICEICVRQNAVDLAGADGMDWPMTPQDLSDALSLSVDFVKTALEHFRARGWISRLPERLIVHKFDELQRLSEFDPAYLHYAPPTGPAGRRSK